jgi:predicted NAD/FAD-binding protein
MSPPLFQAPSAAPKRIAVIGSGVAGLSAAWLLSQRHEVTLYEKDGWLGGHSHTVEVAGADGPIPVDTGFIVYNERNYPNLTALFAHLGVKTEPSTMSFAASVENGGFEYSSASLNRYLGQRRNILRPRFWRMTSDLLRFYRTALEKGAAMGEGSLTLGEYLKREAYSETFVEDHILPMSAAIWSTTPQEIRAYPLEAFVRFYQSHGLFDIRNRGQWRTVTGGSREYVSRLASTINHRRGAARRIDRTPAGILIEDGDGRVERYSEVVIGAHADQALRLLSDADREERRLLGAFRYTPNDAVLHSDPRLMPRNRRVWSSWNFMAGRGGERSRQLSVTYWMNRLQNLDRRVPLFITLNPNRPIAEDKIIGRYACSHPYFDHAALAAQREFWRIQGRNRTWFCGSYLGYGFHEDGLQSGLAVAEAIGGVKRPWPLPAGPGRVATVTGPPSREALAA